MTNSDQTQLKASRNGPSAGALKLSSNLLLRHLAEVAELSEAEGDLCLAEHLVDVVYHLASLH